MSKISRRIGEYIRYMTNECMCVWHTFCLYVILYAWLLWTCMYECSMHIVKLYNWDTVYMWDLMLCLLIKEIEFELKDLLKYAHCIHSITLALCILVISFFSTLPSVFPSSFFSFSHLYLANSSISKSVSCLSFLFFFLSASIMMDCLHTCKNHSKNPQAFFFCTLTPACVFVIYI